MVEMDPKCACGHLRSSHDNEQPYVCFGWDKTPGYDQPCPCRGFGLLGVA
jgi:hypothetical protein